MILFLLTVGLVLLPIGKSLQNLAFGNELDQSLILSAAHVCRGGSLEKARPYDGTKNTVLHSIFLIDQDGIEHTWTYWIPEEMLAKKIETLELVACVKETLETIQTCPYYGGSIQRKRYKIAIDLWEAYSGRRIASENVKGENPRACQSKESMFSSTLMGTRVEFEQVLPFLEQYSRIP